MEPIKILVVDDEPKILKIVERVMRKEGYMVLKALDGSQAIRGFEEGHPDLVILDLMLPKMDGYQVLEKIRQESSVPIIVLSAKGDEMDRIVGFRMGVDDYLPKPFSPFELALRVKAVLRRTLGRGFDREEETGFIEVGEIKINRRTRRVTVAGEEVHLTAKEFDLLWVLASRPNQVFSREQLLKRIWGAEYLGDMRTVTVLVSRLREKLEHDPGQPKYIKTVWGIGYRLECPSE